MSDLLSFVELELCLTRDAVWPTTRGFWPNEVSRPRVARSELGVPAFLGDPIPGAIRESEVRLEWLFFRAFKRPAPAVWGNGLWGSVGGAGRSYD